MSTAFLLIAKHLRPGLYRLAKPVLLESASNFWTGRDARLGDCDEDEVDTPIVYRLHAVRIVSPMEWHGFDEPLPKEQHDGARFAADASAVEFTPADLSVSQLLLFLQEARRVSGPGRRRRHAAQFTGKGCEVSC